MNVPADDMLLNELAAALAKAQGAMNNATMNRINPHFKSKYADLAALWDRAQAVVRQWAIGGGDNS